MNHPIIPAHPLDAGGVVKIALGQAASDALRSVGKYSLLVAVPADATTPEHLRDRLIVCALPITKEQAEAAYLVAAGKARAVKIKLPKPG